LGRIVRTISLSFAVFSVALAGWTSIGLAGTTYYFHGTDADQVNKFVGAPGTATFDQNPPTRLLAITQTGTGTFINEDFVGNQFAIYWNGPFSGAVDGLLELKWFWSTPNAEAQLLGLALNVTVFADPVYSGNRVQPQKIIGRETVTLAPIAATPREFTSTVRVKGTVNSTLLIQVVPTFDDAGQGALAHYDSTGTPSRFSFVPVPPQPTVVHDARAVAFAPSTIVAPGFFGPEPQTTLERRVPASIPGRVDPNRIFVDWPFSTQTQADLLHRSTDGGDSFRLLLDPACTFRNRPNCLTLGGGDSENEVNLGNGNLFFSDQEAVVAQEGIASSLDHGDSFPPARQHLVTSPTTVTDRQWVGWADPGEVNVGPLGIDAFLAWHLPIAGQYVVGIDQNGQAITPAAPQISGVLQSGPIRVDNTDGPGRGWVYQIFRSGTGVAVATAFGDDFLLPEGATPTAWKTNLISSDSATIFPWLNHDSRGNAYAVWVKEGTGELFLSVSPIDDPRNDPSAGGRPGTFWSPKAKINPPSITSTVFPEVTAGDFGRSAVSYMGSQDCMGPSGGCAATAHWDVYAAVIGDALALARGTPLVVSTGKVNHRVVHRGNICTEGAGCGDGDDRSLLDMIDLGFDEAGRVGVVFMNNNNRLAAPNLTDVAKNGPFAHFAKLVDGPSLLATTGDPKIVIPENARPDAAGDATWPNTAAGANLRSFDLLGASVFVAGDDVVARVPLARSTTSGMLSDLAAWNAASPPTDQKTRIHYLFRFETADDVWHMSMDLSSTGSRRFFGGRVDANDNLFGPTGVTGSAGARYVADAGFPVTGSVGQGVLTLRAPKSVFGLDVGSRLFSVSAFALAAPPEGETRLTNPLRVVDATPPFDATLQEGANPPSAPDCDDPDIVTFGGWHTLNDSRAGDGTLCRNVGANKFKSGALMEFSFTGTAVDVVVARGPRGGNFNISLDGGPPTTVDLYRAPSDPSRPDNSGRKDLDLGITLHFPASGTGPHTLRIDVLNDRPDPLRDMVYIDGFVITGGGILPRPAGSTTDVASLVSGTVAAGGQVVIGLVTTTATQHLAAVLATGDQVELVLRDAEEKVLATAGTVGGVASLDVGPVRTGPLSLVIVNRGTTDEAFELWEVLTEQR
jgi:hypothetical protein